MELSAFRVHRHLSSVLFNDVADGADAEAVVGLVRLRRLRQSVAEAQLSARIFGMNKN